ncbi:hypothetical protein [Cellulophaga sp. BC115SP]|uniref:hypothetical protein n=1 Tax=Cellulophaga sp. BC115SP TaxID=2683263 RepID=UPI0014122953|nr:hypothetical protein [Cellulophaga sp. BC115SP]NBB29668.1 hypothetical protein [Cellulophaga sp. BC115SP]
MFKNFIWHLFKKTTFPIDTPYFSCLDTRKVTAAAAAKESQEILNSPAAQTAGFHLKKHKV